MSKTPLIKDISLIVVGLTLFALSIPAHAQQPHKASRLGYLTALSAATDSYRSNALREGLRMLGYLEGQNIAIDFRYADGNLDRLPSLADELIQLKIDVIVASSAPGVLAAKNATKTIPIVMTNVGDPVGEGIIASLARPGGNVSGLTGLAPELNGKRLELLKETVSRLAHVGVLWDPSGQGATKLFKETEVAARAMKLQVQSLEVQRPDDIESAFKAATVSHARALVVLQSGFTTTHRGRIIEFATKDRMPTVFAESAHVESGGLMSYAPSYNDLFRRAATYVDKILKGAKPEDLPVQQPTKFELVINLKTAKAIGVTIPPNVLARADRVIR